MSFTSRREMLFVYVVRDANPNGDPLNSNHPRYDEETEQVLVSDVRIKRTVRDQWLRDNKLVFVDGEPKTLKDRFAELKEKTKKNTGREVMAECLDTRLFGVTFALGKEAFSWTGPVQFKWGRSLHAVTVDFVQGTSAFATDGKKGEDKQQRSFRNEYKVPFAMISVYGIANQFASERTGASDEDLDALRGALWQGTENLITRSKNEHMPVFYLEIIYKPGFAGKIGSLDEKITLLDAQGALLSRDTGRALRSVSQCKLNINPLLGSLETFSPHIERVIVKRNNDLVVAGLEELRNMGLDIAEE
ncbi:type I-B CRISPR-associated protein Cas7/Csh2 [Desulfallas thermosapovorans]|uniref:CRISPR-associated Csh2 family protein n=1 Tax=Desulfallas thermosapovorans DSM 6562 TaxID=1121431 RepID=A0A5S4ZMX0_9FIRM|nr:type I-B CRISPR-associated protein Cas7/Csh2 [Desulfallas thermosapovorans]TYO92775.1 CRISPR-associated Csh2 family protein [Desulfallas thermosapovorans DSM 6562]